MKDKDEKFAHRLGDCLRDADFLDDPAWESLAKNELSDEQWEQIRQQKEQQGMDPTQLKLAQQAFRPMDASFINKIADLVEQTHAEDGPGQANFAQKARQETNQRWLVPSFPMDDRTRLGSNDSDVDLPILA